MRIELSQSTLERKLNRSRKAIVAKIQSGELKPDGAIVCGGKQNFTFDAVHLPAIRKLFAGGHQVVMSLMLFAVLAFHTAAADLGFFNLVNASTNNIAGMATNVYGSSFNAIDVSEVDYLGVQVLVRPTGATTNGAVTLKWGGSIDSTSYDTDWHSMVIPVDGPTNKVFTTVLDVRGLAVLRLVAGLNTNSTAMTNIQVRYRRKAGWVRHLTS
ncbi:MAG TPA: hypothetical protein VNT99_14135 [Methylomirabilota bacterium]|nr:hypothetical protein [Methylomirabilota bacterium]